MSFVPLWCTPQALNQAGRWRPENQSLAVTLKQERAVHVMSSHGRPGGRPQPRRPSREPRGPPVGSLAGEGTRVSVIGVATRSWGLTRLHVNATRSFGSEDEPGIEIAPRWRYSLAADRTLFRRSWLLVGELLVQRTVRDSPVELNVAVGARHQLTPTLVLDFGLSRRLRSRAGPDYGLTVGLSHAFGLPWLMPGNAR